MTKLIFLQDTELKNLNLAKIELTEAFDGLSEQDIIEHYSTDYNHNYNVLFYISNIENNFVLEQLGDINSSRTSNDAIIQSSSKGKWSSEDFEQIQLTNVDVKYDDIHNKEYYEKRIFNINNQQKHYNDIMYNN